ncbi:MAG: hypothetical protein MJ250_02990 [Alphaproteobacteria bacterium]|nr:hypothetical protein [Alphaproteobacteria bacterium]
MFKYFLFIIFFCQTVQAQMVDLRHLSNQRFMEKPHGVAIDRTPQYRKIIKEKQRPQELDEEDQQIAENSEKIEEMPKENNDLLILKTPDLDTSVKQTGINIFQPKDEKKIFKSKIKTEEFDALKDFEKNNIQSRITIDE